MTVALLVGQRVVLWVVGMVHSLVERRAESLVVHLVDWKVVYWVDTSVA